MSGEATIVSHAIGFQREPLDAALWEEAMPLLRAHWEEIAHWKEIALEPDEAMYAAAQEAGTLRCFTARGADGGLVGYALFFVRHAPHYQSSLQAVQDVVYLTPSARGMTGARFLRWCEHQLAAEGVEALYHHVKADHNWGPMLERMGYTLIDHIYGKRLSRWETS